MIDQFIQKCRETDGCKDKYKGNTELLKDGKDNINPIKDTTALLENMDADPYNNRIYDVFAFNILVETHPSTKVHFNIPLLYAAEL